MTQDIHKAVNTALISTQLDQVADNISIDQLPELIQSDAWKAITHAIVWLAREKSLSLQESSEEVIRTFRRVDRTWSSYVFEQGVERIKSGP